MLNPILYTKKVLSDFLRYQLTTYALARILVTLTNFANQETRVH
jgi:hypothetical protein